MAFSDLQPNQMVNGNDAATSGFIQIGPTNAGNECYTKARALATYQLNPAGFAPYSDNQLVPKSAWASGAVGNPFTFSAEYVDTLNICSKPSAQTLYASVANPVVGTIMYANASMTTPFNGHFNNFRNLTSNNYAKISDTGSIMSLNTNCTPVFISLGYEGTGNAFAARYSGQTFQFSRVNANTNSSPGNWVIAQCHAAIPANFTFPTARGFIGFDTSSIVSASGGGIKINLASSGQNNDNSLQAATRFVIVAVSGSHPPNYVFTNSDYTTGLISGTGGGTQLYSEIVTINPGQTGDILIPFNTQGIGSIVAFSSMSFVLMEYDHDWLNVAPTIQYSYNNLIRAASSNVKLYYTP
jgi:hypothetical protein